MSDSAIQPDVPAVAEQPETVAATPAPEPADTKPMKTAREIALDELEARHQQQMAAENGYSLEVLGGEESAPAAPAPAPAAAAAPAEPSPAPAAEPDQLEAQMAAGQPDQVPSKIKIKVDGVEAEVPLDEVVRQYQKNSSADRRLAEATRLLREAQETAAQRLLQEQQRATAAAAPAAPPEPAPADPDREATGKEFLKALFEGDEESALAKLNELTQAGRQAPQPAVAAPTLDLEQISSAVAQHVQQKLVVESALARNRQDYPELYADPDMEGLALAKIQRIREETGTDFFTALDSVSRDFAHKFGWSAVQQGRPPEPVETTSPRAAKLERKTGIDNVVSVNTKITTAEPQPENPSDIIAQMRAARAGGR